MRRLAFACLSALLALPSCRDTATPPPVLQGRSPVDSADQFMVGVETKLIEGGVLRANVEADTAFLYENSARIEMLGFKANFFTSTGVANGVMTANRTIYDTRVDSMQAFGNVKVIGIDGRTLTTPYLRYNKVLDQISSDSAFTMTEPDRTLTGIGFVSDPGMNSFEVKRLIRGTAGTVTLPKR